MNFRRWLLWLVATAVLVLGYYSVRVYQTHKAIDHNIVFIANCEQRDGVMSAGDYKNL